VNWAYVLLGCRVLIGLVFTISLVSKVRGGDSYRRFVAAVADLAPGLPARPAAITVVTGEAAVMVLLTTPVPLLGFAVAVGLLSAFTVAIVAALRRRPGVSCQCFGTSTTPLSRVHVARNVVLSTVAAVGALTATAAGGTLPLGAATAMVALGAGGAVVVALTDDIADLFRSIN
jgi:Methylamine utilisation protein MauE